jgi:hypothetical protein
MIGIYMWYKSECLRAGSGFLDRGDIVFGALAVPFEKTRYTRRRRRR